MERQERKKRVIQLILCGINLLVQILMFSYCYLNYYSTWFRYKFYFWGHIIIIFICALLLSVFSKMFGAFKFEYRKNTDIIFSQIIGTLFTNFIIYLMMSLFCMEMMNLVYYVPMTILQLIWSILWIIIATKVYDKSFPPRNLLLIHGGRPIDDILHKFEYGRDKHQISKTINVSEGVEAVCKEAESGYGGVVIWDIPSSDRNRILKFCYGKSIRVFIMPKISDVILSGAEELHLFDSPMFLTREYALTFEQEVIKRFFDIIFSFVMLIVASPFMLITAILVKAYDGGPVLYKQVRCTKGKKEFKILKFRSMRVDAEKDGVARLATANDDRITPVGKFIRRCRLDELPQLFNILKGDMSLIGPRPERPEIIKQYEESMPEFSYRMKVKAGLAGYAQLYGKYNTSPYDKLKLDICYIENYSIWLDIKLLILTVKILFWPDSTEGVSQDQITALKNTVADDNEEKTVD